MLCWPRQLLQWRGGTTRNISSAEELQALAEECILDTYSKNLNVKLTEDINLNGIDFVPFPIFSGIFDGCGHKISGLKLASDGSEQGLFRFIGPEGSVRNLTVEGSVDPENIRSSVGGIVGANFGRIENCVFRGSVHGTETVGGIAGENYGIIVKCINEGSVMGKRFSGGIAGQNEGKISNCQNAGKINTRIETSSVALEDISFDITGINLVSANDSDSVTDTGGIAGISSGIIDSCENRGEVGYQHFGYNVGGIAGRQSGYVSNCVNYGTVLGRKDIAGIVGQMEPYMILTSTDNLLDELQAMSTAINSALVHLDANSEGTGSVMDDLKGDASAAAENVWEINQTSDDPLIDNKKEKDSGVDWDAVGEKVDEYKDKTTEAIGNIDEETISHVIEGNPTEEDIGKIAQEGGGVVGDGAGEIADRIAEKRAEEDAREAANEQARVGLDSNMDSMSSNIGRLSEQLSDTTSILAQDLQNVNGHYYKVMTLAANLLSGNFDILTDISDLDTHDDTYGKVFKCINRGAIAGDSNIGGIGGEMGIEMEHDLEGILTAEIDHKGLISNSYETRCIARTCVNNGIINGKKDHIGGVVGSTELGTVIECEGYGTVSSEDGSYVGGVVGYSNGVIRDSYAMCSIKGSMYVGGIVGYGNSIVNCCSLVDLKNTTASCGTIAGWADVSFEKPELEEDDNNTNSSSVTGIPTVNKEIKVSGNYYVHESLGAINGISYEGIAEPISNEKLLLRPNLPDAFRTLHLTFIADGETVGELEFNYGESIDESLIPEVPTKKGYTGYWPEYDYSHLHFSDTIEAIYVTRQGTMEAATTREGSSQPVVLVEGSFDSKSSVSIVSYRNELPVLEDGTVLEAWTMTIDGSRADIKDYTIHYLKPELKRGGDKLSIYACDSEGNWNRISTRSSGKYLTFAGSGNSVTFCAVKSGANHLAVIALISILVILTLAAVIFFRGRLKKSSPEGEEKKLFVFPFLQRVKIKFEKTKQN